MKKILFTILSLNFLVHCGEADLKPLERFDWSSVMKTPPEDNSGNQIFHFKTTNKKLSESAEQFVKENLKDATELESDAEVLKFASDNIKIKDGFILEMGVATGRSINFLAGLNPKRTLYGFDSFEGLPEKWDRPDAKFGKLIFGFKDKRPRVQVLKNVTLYKGWFKEVLPKFKQQILKEQPIALLHIDSDIYSSSVDIFNALDENIVSGTVIVFDEFYNYPNSENHEYKAFMEFIERTGKKFKYIAYNINHEQVAVEIL